jgi:hypothetical protein
MRKFLIILCTLLPICAFAQFNRGDNAIPGAIKVYPGDHWTGSDMCAKIGAAVSANPGSVIDATQYSGTQVCTAAHATTMLFGSGQGGALYLGNVQLYIDGAANFSDGNGSGVGTPALILPNKWGALQGVSRGGTGTAGTTISVCTGSGTPAPACTTAFPVRSFSITTTSVVSNTMTINATGVTTSNVYVGEYAQVNGSGTTAENRMYKVLTVGSGTITVTVNSGTSACASSCGTLYLGTPVLGMAEPATGAYNNSSCAGNCNSFGEQIVNIAINCQYQNGCIGIQNLYANENSYLNGFLITNSPFLGLDVHGNVSQHSGPFKNGEIYTGAPRTTQNITSIACSAGTCTITWASSNAYTTGQWINIGGTSVAGCNSRVQLASATTFSATTYAGTCATSTGGTGTQEASCQEGTTAIAMGDIDHGPIEDVTYNMNAACQKQALSGAIIDAANQEISGDSHAEGWTDDVLIGFNAASSSPRVVDFSCQVPGNPGTNCVHVSGNFKSGTTPTSDYNFQNIRRQSGTTNNILDDVLGYAITDTFVACYAADWNNTVGFWGLSSCNPAVGVEHPWYKSFPNTGPSSFATNEGAIWESNGTGSPWVFRQGGASTVFNMVGASSLLSGTAGTVTCSDGTGWGITTSGCSGGGGSGTINAATQYSLPYYSAAGSATTLSGVTAATTPASVPQTFVSIPTSGGAATAPILQLAGVLPNAQTGTTYTVAVTDRAGYVSFSNAASIAVTLPQAGSTGFGTNFVFVACDIGAGTATITPTTSTISYSSGSGYTSGASSLALQTGDCAWIYSDNTNYFAIAFLTGRVASGTITLPTTAIASNTCTLATATATGATTADTLSWSPNADIHSVTGYGGTSGFLTIYPYITANTANLNVCNFTGSSITPGAVTVNFRINR